jgi:cobyrinic acid a,c-diamide synthase
MHGLVIAGTNSGSGKTTITLGMLAALKKKKYTVQPFKTGPDFIDTGLHGLITGRTSRNLDLWMCGSEYVRDCFEKNSADADIAVIEGVMGMYDGTFSTAHLAAELGLPVVLIVDAYGMAESAGAIVKGFAEYSAVGARSPRPELAGVIFNRIASERHYKRVKEGVQDLPVFGYLPRDIEFNIPHRHLGLVVAEENPIDADEIDKLADAVLEYIDVEQIVRKCGCAEARKEKTSDLPTFRSSDLKIAVAYDKAFCFYYEDNLDLLRQAGAEIVTFSPLSDSRVPEGADALYLGGGYPELNAKELSANRSMLDSVKDFSDSGRPVYAECGGFMYLTEGIHDFEGNLYPMAGAFPFKAKMIKGRMRLGYREAVLREDSILGRAGDTMRGHEFHYSEIEESGQLSAVSCQQTARIYAVKDGSGKEIGNEGYRVKNTIGSYIHIHFGSNPEIAGHLINKCKEHHGTDTFNRTR